MSADDDFIDYYDFLGVEPDVSEGVIQKAYRKKAFEYHPDRNKDNPAAGRFGFGDRGVFRTHDFAAKPAQDSVDLL